jgi:hypothetical protein
MELDFPIVALLVGATITIVGAIIPNKDVIIVGSNFVTAAGTAYQVQNRRATPRANKKDSSSSSSPPHGKLN